MELKYNGAEIKGTNVDYGSSGKDGQPPETKVEEKRAALLSTISPLVYPPDLNEEFYIEFNAFKANTTRADEAKRTFNFEKSVYLPFPQSVTDQYGASYNEEALFFGGEFLKNSLDTLMTSNGTKKVANLFDGGAADRAGNIAAGILEKIGKAPGEAAAAVGAYYLSGVGGPIGSAAKASLNVTTNPYPVMIFGGVGFKPAFSFSWTFFPESPEETKTINKIIGYFRREMLPERLEQIPSILKYPAIFEVSINPSVKKFKRCVVTNLDINYTPAGPAFVRDAPQVAGVTADSNPAAITMTLSLKEVEVWLANDFYPTEENNFDFIKGKDTNVSSSMPGVINEGGRTI